MSTENNKPNGNHTIAEFMGMKKLDMSSYICWEYAPDKFMFDVHKYDTDWTDLMEVIDKINLIRSRAKIPMFQKISEMDFAIFRMRLGGPPIRSVFNAVIEFIEWYNKNKK